MIRIVVHGRPAPKGSRIQGRTKEGKGYTYPASKYERPWVKAVTDATLVVMRHHQTPEPPYAIDLAFLIAPTQHAKNQKLPWPTQHDVDKLARAVVDGLVNGGAIEDDRHVLSLHATKRFAAKDEQSGVICHVDRYVVTQLSDAA